MDRVNGMRVMVVGVDASQGLLIKVATLAAVLDTGLIVDADNVGASVTGVREAGEGQEATSHGIGGQLVRGRALEPNDSLALAFALVHLVGVVADVVLGTVGLALLARSLVGHAISTLQGKSKIS